MPANKSVLEPNIHEPFITILSPELFILKPTFQEAWSATPTVTSCCGALFWGAKNSDFITP
jgi:hypothetical protein